MCLSMNASNLSNGNRAVGADACKALGKTAIGAALAVAPRPGYTAENNTIKIALVGCGGRGTGDGCGRAGLVHAGTHQAGGARGRVREPSPELFGQRESWA
ncbi:hypothetical protein SBV1_960059 [Verrucomicrobia bacterium]|nr:hypothetical protein SBV1_960059 [Verrucomicrobiota bacterium]